MNVQPASSELLLTSSIKQREVAADRLISRLLAPIHAHLYPGCSH
jgi:hypothetical protein